MFCRGVENTNTNQLDFSLRSYQGLLLSTFGTWVEMQLNQKNVGTVTLSVLGDGFNMLQSMFHRIHSFRAKVALSTTLQGSSLAEAMSHTYIYIYVYIYMYLYIYTMIYNRRSPIVEWMTVYIYHITMCWPWHIYTHNCSVYLEIYLYNYIYTHMIILYSYIRIYQIIILE